MHDWDLLFITNFQLPVVPTGINWPFRHIQMYHGVLSRVALSATDGSTVFQLSKSAGAGPPGVWGKKEKHVDLSCIHSYHQIPKS